MSASSGVASTEARNAKILRFEKFLSEKLQPDLRALLEQRDKVVAEVAEFSALKQTIQVGF